MAFEAFVNATVVGPNVCYSPKVRDIKLRRPRSAAASFRHSLPSPQPPSTCLDKDRNPWRKREGKNGKNGKKAEDVKAQLQVPLAPLGEPLIDMLNEEVESPISKCDSRKSLRAKIRRPFDMQNEESESPMSKCDSRKSVRAKIRRPFDMQNEESESPMSKCDSRKAMRAKIRRPWREDPPSLPGSPKSDPVSPKSRWKIAVDAITERNSALVKQRSHMNQSVRRRIRAFDERMAILANGGVKAAANENSDTEDDQGGSQMLSDLAFSLEQKEEKAELVEMPFKVIAWSSQRGNFPAFNLLGTSSCWQSEIGMTRDQHLTFELEDIPAPLVAIQMEVVTKEVTPKRCKLMFSTNSPMGPWQTAWTFFVPESVAERGLRFFNRSKEEIKSGMESAPWWRLAIADNYGSQACIAIAAPLKLLVEGRGDHARLKQVKKTTISSFLDNFSFGQARLASNLSVEEKMDKRLATTYKLRPEFIADAHMHFNEMDRSKCGRWSKKDWQTWMVQFMPPKDRNKATTERMTFFWNRMDKDESFTIDFEEFVIFWHVLTQTAETFNLSFGELLFPGIVKKELPEPTGEEAELPPKPPEELVEDSMDMSWKLSRNKQEQLIRDVVAQSLPKRRTSLLSSGPHDLNIHSPDFSLTGARKRNSLHRNTRPKQEPMNLARASMLLAARNGNPEREDPAAE